MINAHLTIPFSLATSTVQPKVILENVLATVSNPMDIKCSAKLSDKLAETTIA